VTPYEDAGLVGGDFDPLDSDFAPDEEEMTKARGRGRGRGRGRPRGRGKRTT